MPEYLPQLLVGLSVFLVVLLIYAGARFTARRKLGTLLRRSQPWQPITLQEWALRGWLRPEAVQTLPESLNPAGVFYEWAAVDPDITLAWRFREPIRVETPVEALVRDAWSSLPAADQERTRARLAEAVRTAGAWWGGVERGWNGRPLVLLAGAAGRKSKGLPLLDMEDLTAAPAPSPLDAELLAKEGEGADLVLALAALRGWKGDFTHPLAPPSSRTGSLIEGLSTRAATDLGRRVGAGIGAVLGPIGSMIGQHLGGVVGAMGGKAIAGQMLPEPVADALKETERALAHLGELAMTKEFEKAAGWPAEAVLETGKQVELRREARARRFRERLWPTSGLYMVQETLRITLSELRAHRNAAPLWVNATRQSPEAVAGGIILQNPWVVRALPEGPERLNAARATLNRSAAAIRKSAASIQRR